MAIETVTANPGSGGAGFQMDKVGAAYYPLMKIDNGAEGAAGGPVTTANPFPVAVQGTVPVSGTFWQATQPVSGTVTANAGTNLNTSALALESGGNLATLVTRTTVGQTTMSASRPVAIASDQSTIPVNQAGVSATGSLAALNATVALSLTGASGWAVDLRGTFVATVTFQGTIDGTNWFTIAVIPAGGATSVATVTTATAAGSWWGNANGCQKVRAIATAYTSGTVTVVLRAMQAAGVASVLVTGATTVPVSGTVTANIGTGSIAAGTNLAMDVGVQVRATTNGTTVTNILSAASNNLTQLKGTAGKIAGGFLTNTTASVQYLKLFNVPSASVTAGTTNATTQIALQPNQTVNLAQGDLGIFLGGTGITIMIVTGSALNDNTATTAGSVVGFIAWV
ncbi:MAG: hypothetical protein INF12_14665 [Methylobacterium sp.]|nr:hypothetical protein [Methylobacterium sp.]